MKQIITLFLITIGIFNISALELNLKDCRDMALATDENIKIAENNVAGADIDRQIAHTAYLPNFAGSGNLLYYTPDSKIGDMMTMQMRGAYMAGINLTQPIYTGGKITAANKMARIGRQISEEQLRATRMDVIADAEKSYWTYVAVLSKVDMMKSYISMMDSIYDVTEFSVNTGMAPQQALLRVDTKRSEIIYRLQQTKAGADMCRMALCRIIGVADTVSIIPVEPINSDFNLPGKEISIDNRPETMMLSKSIDIKRYEVTMARADFLPTIGMQLGWMAYGNIKMKGWSQDQTGNYIPVSSSMNSNGFMGVLSLQVPIFHWGEGIKKVKRAKIEVENARLSLERNKRLMQLEANQNYNNLVTGVALVKSAETALHEADENLRIMQEQYEVGLCTLTDLLEAQSQWHSSYSNLIEARTQYRIYHVDYLRSIGELE
ncbi:MAG: TolC family protein [Muribaculaceae bacterium]|nr:TolC family protein [Muribaculaceae bacterium]